MSIPVAYQKVTAYIDCVAANSATGFDGPTSTRRTEAPLPTAGAFFVPAARVYGSCARETARSAGILVPRSVNLRIAATLHDRLTAVRGSSKSVQGATQMKSTIIRSRIAAHRAMALAALRSDSSLKVRLDRYNAHAEKARALEAMLCNSAAVQAGGAA